MSANLHADAMETLTLFTWGYWGWGSATDQLIRAVDAVEVARGYKPPMFVDVRISRRVRAPGFNGRAFEQAIGTSRYCWLPELGNVGVLTRGPIRIKDPAAAETLLDIAQACASNSERLLFFCSCEFPGVEGQEGCCHRAVVAGLALQTARRRKLPTQIVEWPGGQPVLGLEVRLRQAEFEKLGRGSRSILIDDPETLADIASIPWFSPVTVRREEESEEESPHYLLLTGPARYKTGGWYLPIYEGLDPDMSDEQIAQRLQELRKRGFEARHA